MLKKLTVSNLAVVEEAKAEFSPGLNVLTGETGAGKSVLMGALGLVLGERADASVVRDGAKEAEVEADFEVDFAEQLNKMGCKNEIYNVGCMYWNFEPVTLDEIIAHGKTVRPNYGTRTH